MRFLINLFRKKIEWARRDFHRTLLPLQKRPRKNDVSQGFFAAVKKDRFEHVTIGFLSAKLMAEPIVAV